MRPEVKNYLDVFQYLRDFYNFRKSLNTGFSYQVWSRELGIKNKSYLRFITLGRRPISEKMLALLTTNLELKDADAEYFQLLCQYSQSKNSVQKKLFGKRLIGLLKVGPDSQEVEPHFEFLSSPILPKLLTLLSFADIAKTPANLGRLLLVSEDEIEKSLEALRTLKLIEDSERGPHPLKTSFKVPDRYRDLGLANYYCRSLEDARRAIHLPAEERRFRSLLVAMNPDEFREYVERLNEFAREQLEKHDFADLADRRLYQVNFNAFPVSQ